MLASSPAYDRVDGGKKARSPGERGGSC